MSRVVVQLDGGGVWWPAEGHLWANAGRAALPPTHDEAEARASVARHAAGEFWCSGCRTWHAGPPAFQRFAGRYCEQATDEFKAANARTCLLCRRPVWDCYC